MPLSLVVWAVVGVLGVMWLARRSSNQKRRRGN